MEQHFTPDTEESYEGFDAVQEFRYAPVSTNESRTSSPGNVVTNLDAYRTNTERLEASSVEGKNLAPASNFTELSLGSDGLAVIQLQLTNIVTSLNNINERLATHEKLFHDLQEKISSNSSFSPELRDYHSRVKSIIHTNPSTEEKQSAVPPESVILEAQKVRKAEAEALQREAQRQAKERAIKEEIERQQEIEHNRKLELETKRRELMSSLVQSNGGSGLFSDRKEGGSSIFD